ncbi:MAG: hypothetical protein CUN55_19840 [Phototrophicales bacterium]|nr:MAG: hypothetical protein CUN55_19840 [Phototrophicales bacterium]
MMAAVSDPIALRAHLEGLFQRCGFKMPQGHAHAEDHLSTLLYLLGVIRHRQHKALAQSSQTDPQEFEQLETLFNFALKHHLLNWAPAWIEKAHSSAQSVFYKVVFEMLSAVLDEFRAKE